MKAETRQEDASGAQLRESEAMKDEAEKRACLAKLDDLAAQIDAVLAVFGKRTRLAGPDKIRAQELLRQLKGRLNDEYHRTSRDRALLNWTEQTSYAPAVHEASAGISVRVNSIPDQRWFDDLGGTRFDIEFYARQLRDQLAERSPVPRPQAQ